MIKVNIILSEINYYKNKLTEFEKEHITIENNIKTVHIKSVNDCNNYVNIMKSLNEYENKYKNAIEYNAKIDIRKDKLKQLSKYYHYCNKINI